MPSIVTPEPAPSTPVLQEEDVASPSPSDDVVMEDAPVIKTRVLHPFQLSTLN